MAQDNGKKKIILIAGPTAVGKTTLAIRLAEKFDGEIISADSMQLYKYMNIGTAKPTNAELKKVRHHLIDILEPDQDYTAARYKEDAAKAIDEITARGKKVFICGGSGLYIRALTEGIFSGPKADPELRARLMDEARSLGNEALFERLKAVDPESAKKTHPNNLVRVIRALEVFDLTGKAISSLHLEHAFGENPYNTLRIGLNMDRSELNERINERTEKMIAKGLIAEVEGLLKQGYREDLKPMQGLGYKEILSFLQGPKSEADLREAKEEIKQNTRRYAKRQMTWFKGDPAINWFLAGSSKDIAEIEKKVEGFFAS